MNPFKPCAHSKPKHCNTDDTIQAFLGDESVMNWLPPRDSNPDNLLQRQVSYH